MVLIESLLVMGFSYPLVNVAFLSKKKKEIESLIKHETKKADGLFLLSSFNNYIPPMYINFGKVSLPVGSDYYVDYEIKYSTVQNENIKLINYDQLNYFPFGTKYINTYEELDKFGKDNKIQLDSFEVKLPIKVQRMTYQNGLYYLPTMKMIAINKKKLVNHALIKSRLPFSLTVLSLSTIGTILYFNNLN